MLQVRSVAVALLVSFAPLAVPMPAFAQTDDPTTKAARARFQEGVDFYDKGQYENARAAFLQAYALKKHPAVLLNLAQSSLRSSRPLEASRYFQQFLRESQGLSTAQRDTANTGLNEARAKLGRIEVAAPPNTEITLDGERAGVAPLADPLDVEPGTHAVKGRLPEGKEEQQTVTVGAGQRATARFSATPAPVPAPVAVPVPVPTPEPPPVAEPSPAVTATARLDAASAKGPGLLAPPATMVPVWIGLVVSVGGGATAVAFAVAKSSAQSNATSVESAIRANGGGTGTCSSTDSATLARFGKACGVLADNRSAVDTDALIANVGIAVGAAGLATAVGWYLFAPKRDAAPKTGFRSITPAPLAGQGATGVAFAGVF